MTDQAEALRRLMRARGDWKALTDEPTAPLPVERGGGLRSLLEAADPWTPLRRAGSLLGLGEGRARKGGRNSR